VVVSRVVAFFAMVVAIALVPLLNSYQSIFAGINDIIAHIAPPITAVFMMGIFWPRASAVSAKLTLWIGSGLGALAYAIKTMSLAFPETFFWVPGFFVETPFMMMAFYLLVACLLMQVVFTYRFPKGADEDRERLHWRRPLEALEAPGWPGLSNYKVLGGLLMVAMGVLYYLFR
jgi:SSS family solute:Na+ symporter